MRNHILFVCEGVQHLASTMALGKHLKKIGMEASLFYPRAFPQLPGLRNFKFLITDKLAIPGMLQNVGLVVFFTNESSPFCMTSNRIGFIAKKTGTPTVTVQHGWLQPGLNYHSTHRKVGFIERESDNSHAIWHFSPIINFFGNDGIGYPLGVTPTPIEMPNREELNVLISTNFNWNVYSRESIVGFLRSLISLKQNFPFLNLMQRAHPAERSKDLSNEIGFYMDIAGVSEGQWPDILGAIEWADIVVSTPSTAVLDAYFKGVPAFIYKPEEFANALADVNGISFNNGKELTALVGTLITKKHYADPCFPSFDAARFESAIKKHLGRAKPFNLSEEDFLTYVGLCR